MKPAIFLDRDGVINRNEIRNGRPYAPVDIKDFILLPGVRNAVEALRAAGYLIVLATNQPDVRAGRTPRETIEAMHELLRQEVPIDRIEICYHVDQDNCSCRKPKPGMLLRAARDLRIDLANSWMIGDRWRDVAAGRAAGCRTVFVDYGYDEPRPDRPDFVVRSLAEAVPLVLNAT